MAKLSVAKGATSVMVRVFIQNSTSTTGAGLTGLVFNTSGLTCVRMRDDDANNNAVVITLVTATRGTWTSAGFTEKDSTNAPGWYEFGVPNAALVTGSRSVSIHFQGAANMAPCPIEIELTGVDNQDAVHGGMSALPNTACTTNASLLTSGTGTDQLSVASGRVDIGKILGTASAGQAGSVGIDWGQVANKTTANALTGTTISSSQVVASVTGAVGSVTGSVGSIAGVTFPANFAALGITAGGKVSNVALCDTLTTYTGDTPQTGDCYARIGANGVGLTALAPASTALSVVQWTNARAANLDFLDAAVSTRSIYAGGAVASVTAPVTVSLVQPLAAARALDAVSDTSLTLNDALHCAIAAAAGKEAVVGTAYTVKTPSTGSVLRTFVLDSATSPTSRQ